MHIEQAAETLKTTYRILLESADLSPANTAANDAINHMVCEVCKWQPLGIGACLLARADLQEARNGLPQLCARAEYENERHWAERFLQQSVFDAQTLRTFCDYDNYIDMVDSELALIGSHRNNMRGFSFVGGGPLPMTVMVMALHLPDAEFECVDWNADACLMAQGLIEKMGLQNRIRVVHSKAQNYIPPADMFPIVASLIEGKPAVYEAYQNAGVNAFIVRDAEDVYEFVYRPAERPDANHWREGGKTPLCATRFNTTRLYVKKEVYDA